MSDDTRQSKRRRGVLNRRNLLLGALGAAGAGVAGAAFILGKADVGLVPGRSRARPVTDSVDYPSQVDVVVIGGGIVGTTAAFVLADRGVRVALCEKGVVGGEASGRSMGFIYSQYEDADKAQLIARSNELWLGLSSRAGQDVTYRRAGILAPLDTEDEKSGAEMWVQSMRGAPGFDGRLLSSNEVAALCPGMLSPPSSALLTPSDGAVEPRLAAPSIAEGAKNKGAYILQGCAVRGLETSAGRLSGVVTEKGPISCKAVILAGGAWTPLFARSLGIPFDQFDVYLSMAGLSAVPGPSMNLSGSSYGFRKCLDGKYSFGVIDLAAPIQPATIANWRRILPVAEAFSSMSHPGFSPSEFWHELRTPTRWSLDGPSPFEERRILMPAFRGEPLEAALAQLKARFPAFDAARVEEKWAGVMSATLDNMPVISAVSGHPDLYIGSGFMNGMTLGPAAGEALADLATGRPTQVDLHNFRLSRFTDGSVLRLRT